MIEPASVVEIAPKLCDLFSEPAFFYVARGGRGSAKSWGFARTCLAWSMQSKIRILCARDLQVSIRDSVHKLLCDQIDVLGWSQWFTPHQHDITNVFGSEFLFEGLRHNTNKIKSMEGIDVVWVEEAEKVSTESWRVLLPTIRKAGSRVLVSYNPDLDEDPTHVKFTADELPPRTRICEIGHADNPWFPDELRVQMEYDYRIDAETAAHVWGGKTRKNSQSQILRGKYRVESFEPQAGWDGPYYGVDWGFSQDPTAGVECWIDTIKNTLYIRREAYKIALDIDKTPQYLKDRLPGIESRVSRADSARPETISYVRKNGVPNMQGVEKWSGSVEDGVAYLRGFEAIVIHGECTHTADEARLYSYKVDRLSGDVLTDIVDAHNHIIDAIRYALAPMIRSGRSGMLDFYRQEAEKFKAEREAAKNPANRHPGMIRIEGPQ